MEILLYEDKICDNLFPLSLLRGTFDIKCGVFSNKERAEILLKKKVSVNCRKRLLPYLREIYPGHNVNEFKKDDYLFINSRVVLTKENLDFLLKSLPDNSVLFKDNLAIAAKILKEKTSLIKERFENPNRKTQKSKKQTKINLKRINISDLKSSVPQFNVLKFSSDAIRYFDDMLQSDLKILFKNKKKVIAKNKNFINRADIYTGKNVNVSPHAVIDATVGQVYLDDDTVVEPFCYLKGPLYVGKKCILKSGTKIYGPCNIGYQSRVSGEISHSIFHSNVNKQHDGFIGHTYACDFVNFGADTVTSNLKNNYSQVSVDCGNKKVNTGMQFLGSLVGDHSKFGINTMLNTGTMVGIFANIAGGGFPDKFIKSFSWNILGKESKTYKLEEALNTARKVIQRRGIQMSSKYEELVKFTFKNTKF